MRTELSRRAGGPQYPHHLPGFPLTATLQASTPWLCISPLPGRLWVFTVLWVAGRTQPPQYDVVLKQVPALPSACFPGTVSSLCSSPSYQGCGLVRSLSFNSLAWCLACSLCSPPPPSLLPTSPQLLLCLAGSASSQLRPHDVPSQRTCPSWATRTRSF